MKKLLLISDYFRPEPGGIEGFVTGIARRWPKNFIEVIVTADDGNGLYSTETRTRFDRAEGYPIHRVEQETAGSRFSTKGRELVRKRIEAFTPSHVLFCQVSSDMRTTVRDVARLGVDCSLLLNEDTLRRRIRLIDRLFLYRHIKYFFVLSRSLARLARIYGIPDEKIVLLPFGVDLRDGLKRPAKLPINLEKRWKGKHLLLGAGSFVQGKGFDASVEMLVQNPDIQNQVHLVLCGSGPAFHYLQEYVSRLRMDAHVTMTGFIRDEYLSQLLREADLFLLPGKKNSEDTGGIGASLMEAAYFGIPAVVGNTGAMGEIVKNGVSGYVLDAGNVDQLSDRVRELISSEKLRIKMGKNAMEIAKKEFDIIAPFRTIYRTI